MHGKMKLSIIIVSYNSRSVLENCLHSIEKCNDIGDELEVIVVDNYEKSDLAACSFQDFSIAVKYIKADNNGFGAGNNIGASNSSSNVLLFLNPDTILLEPFFEEVVSNIQENHNLIYGFTLLSPEMNRNNSFSFMYDNFIVYHLLAYFKKHPNKKLMNYSFVNKRLWPWGAAFAISKSAFNDAGRFDENIFLCNEEADLMKRVNNRKVIISDFKIIHLESHGVPSTVRRCYEFLKSRDYYFKKYNISKFNLFLWNQFTYLLALRDKRCLNNEGRLNFYKAYIKYISEKK